MGAFYFEKGVRHLKTNPYTRTEWEDHIVDPINGEVLEEGTRFTAARANNIEWGIWNSYEWITAFNESMQKMQVQIDMMGRAPVNNGSFFDTNDGASKAITRDVDRATAQTALSAGATTINLNAVPFAVGEFVAVYDDTNQEIVEVTATASGSITISALSSSYKKGAMVARTNAVVDSAGNKLVPGSWGTYKINVTEVV